MIIEAVLRGTPSLGTDRGGIPEAIGGAGIVLPQMAGPQMWVDAIRTTDHDILGEQARQEATRLARPRLPDLEALGIYPAANAPST
ncbi:hypothetical protein [Streptomyces triticiradicis]|uniref:hypothetical protein n=1 Tax=Streptomyces triticiradicis TaxID=2651189 RepID=UPI001788C24D|nr:hypothetical protein [Streptomyces triticiradicis]